MSNSAIRGQNRSSVLFVLWEVTMIGNKRRISSKRELYLHDCVRVKGILMWFGITFKVENGFEKLKYRNYAYSNTEFEEALNRLCEYMLGDSREVHYHYGRMIPYIEHKEFSKLYGNNRESDKYDSAGQLTHYTHKDYLFMWLVDYFTSIVKKGTKRAPNMSIRFLDVDYFIENTKKGEITHSHQDKPIGDMFVDFLFW